MPIPSIILYLIDSKPGNSAKKNLLIHDSDTLNIIVQQTIGLHRNNLLNSGSIGACNSTRCPDPDGFFVHCDSPDIRIWQTIDDMG